MYGYDFAGTCENDYPSDGCGPKPDPQDTGTHGSHCAGIVGAVRNNGVGISGIAPRVKIMCLKVSPLASGAYDAGRGHKECLARGASRSTGWHAMHVAVAVTPPHAPRCDAPQVSTPSNNFYTAHILKAYDYAYRMGAHVVSCSFGPAEPNMKTISPDELAAYVAERNLYRAALQPMVDKNMLIIAAAGGFAAGVVCHNYGTQHGGVDIRGISRVRPPRCQAHRHWPAGFPHSPADMPGSAASPHSHICRQREHQLGPAGPIQHHLHALLHGQGVPGEHAVCHRHKPGRKLAAGLVRACLLGKHAVHAVKLLCIVLDVLRILQVLTPPHTNPHDRMFAGQRSPTTSPWAPTLASSTRTLAPPAA